MFIFHIFLFTNILSKTKMWGGGGYTPLLAHKKWSLPKMTPMTTHYQYLLLQDPILLSKMGVLQKKTWAQYFNPTSHWALDSVAPIKGPLRPPQDIKEGDISDLMLPCSNCYLVYLGVTCKRSARNNKILARCQDFKILWNWDFASPWQTKNGLDWFWRYRTQILLSSLICIAEQNHTLASTSKDH